jgi:hypothetical protein
MEDIDDSHPARRDEADEASSRGGNDVYKLRIDKENLQSEVPVLTGRALLDLAGKNPPEQFQIFRKMPGGQLIEIPLDGNVDLREPGIERFVTLPLDQTEGELAAGGEVSAPPAERRQLRRHFRLPEHDEAFLDGLGLDWETVREKDILRLVIYQYPVPAGYTLCKVTLNLRIEPAYPDTQIDMVYFLPHLCRVDGRAIGALSTDDFDGATWQRWSRHRTSGNPWRLGLDDISSHLALVDHWLARELMKAA